MDERRIVHIAGKISLKAMGGIHVAVRDLPDAVQRALKRLRYGRRDIEVIYDSKYSVSTAFEGNRALSVTVDLSTGRISDAQQGSWGGSNPFEDRALDREESFNVPNGSVVIAGEAGGRGNFLRIYVRPGDVDKLMPEPDDDVILTPDEKAALGIVGGIKSSYRAQEFLRHRLGEYGKDNPIIESLAEKGLVKIMAQGIRITTQGRNAR